MQDSIETIDGGNGYAINVHYDHDVANPFGDWDGMPTVVRFASRRSGSHIDTIGADDFITEPTREQIAANLDAVKQLLGVPSLMAARHYSPMAHYQPADFVDCVAEACEENSRDSADNFVTALNMCGFAADYISLRDSDVVAVLTPRFFEVSGCENNAESNTKQLRDALELYRQWADGECYYYTIKDANGDTIEDSCGGFLGYDHETSGLLDAAREDIADHARIEKRRQAESAARAFAPFPNLAQN